MSSAIAPPSPAAPGPAEALFAEARRRRRRRRFTAAVVVFALAASAIVAFTATRPDRVLTARGAGRARAGMAVGPVAGLVAWVDFNGRLHLGDLASVAQRVVAKISAGTSLVPAGGHLYWVNSSNVVQELEPATGKIRAVAPGGFVFPSGDGRHLFISATDTRLIELPAGGAGRSRALTLPHGWYMPGGGGSLGVAGGVLVQSDRNWSARAVTAVWNPKSGALKTIGKGMDVLAAYTPPGGQDGLLAWQPVTCTQGQDCPLEITSTATGSTRTVRGSLGYGFGFDFAFSPGGTQLAVFAYTDPYAVRLAMVSTRTGALRLSGTVLRPAGHPAAGWVQWLPDGRHLIIGGTQASYAVNAATLSARPLYLMHGTDHDLDVSQDINYTTVVVPLRR